MICYRHLINDRFTHTEYFGDFAIFRQLCKRRTSLWSIQGFFHAAHVDVFHPIILDFGKRFFGISVGIPALHRSLACTKYRAHVGHAPLLGFVPWPTNQCG